MAIIQTYFNASGGSLGDKRSNLDKELPIGMGAFDDLHEGIEGEFGGGGKGRKGSFKEAKNKASIPKSQQPDRVRHERLTDQPGNVHSREYDFTRTKDGAQVTIREHSLGHKKGNLGPHFNTEIRPRGGGPRQPLSRGADDHTFF